MAYKKLKTFKSYGVRQDGSRIGGFRDAPDQQIYIESTGKCRLFLKVPDYVAGVFPSWKYSQAAAVEKIGEGTAAGVEAILTARDPETLESAWNALCEAYSQWTKSQNLQPVISIKAKEPHHRSGRAEQYIDFSVEFCRYLTNKADDGTMQFYEWREDDTRPLRALRIYRDEGEVVPYTPELWEKLIAFKAQIDEAYMRMQALIADGSFAQRLLAGGGPLLLGAD